MKPEDRDLNRWKKKYYRKEKKNGKPDASWKKNGKDLGGEKRRIRQGFLIYLETKERTGLTMNSFVSI